MIGGSIREKIEVSIREIVFGTEDALVSTLGAVTGIAAGTGDSYIVILSGIVLIFAESLSMAAGSYLSSKSAQEVMSARSQQDLSRLRQQRVHGNETLHDMLERYRFSTSDRKRIESVLEKEHMQWLHELERCEKRLAPSLAPSPFRAGLVMGIFYLIGGVFPLFFYFVLPATQAIAPSIILTAVLLFMLGIWKAKITGGYWLKSGLEMTTVSLSAAIVGFVVGSVVSSMFGG